MRSIKNSIISKFGGQSVVAQICGVHVSAVSQWELIPAKHQIKLYAAAKRLGVELHAEDFFPPPTTNEQEKHPGGP